MIPEDTGRKTGRGTMLAIREILLLNPSGTSVFFRVSPVIGA
jgi:hypothetical protein